VWGAFDTGAHSGVQRHQVLDAFDHGRWRRADGAHDHGVRGELGSTEQVGEIAGRIDVFTDRNEVVCVLGTCDDDAADVIDEHNEFGADQ
jgi:hypothetical protein